MSYIPSPFPLDQCAGVRRVYWSGHQSCYAAYWHAWIKDSRGDLVALLEMPDGSIRYERCLYGLTFVDRLES